MEALLTNASLYSVPLTGFGDDRPKPSVIHNGDVAKMVVKPITPWQRGFIESVQSSVSGRLVTVWKDGNRIVDTVTRVTTLLPDQHLQRALPGTATMWNTTQATSAVWQGTWGEKDFDSTFIAAVAAAKTKGWDLGTLMAERRKTLSLLRRLIPTLLNQTRTILSSLRNPSRMRKFLSSSGEGGASSMWLYHRYGLRPIVFDIIEAHARMTEIHEQLFRVATTDERSRTLTEKFNPAVLAGVNLPSGWSHAGGIPADPLRGVGTVTRVVNARAVCGVGVRAFVQGQYTVNPMLTAWELVPFSFVLDWVLNIGDNLVAWSPAIDRTLEYGWLSLRHDIVLESTADYTKATAYGGVARPYGSNVLYRRGYSDCTLKMHTVIRAKTFQRYKLDLSSVPTELSLRFNLDFWKMLDLAALSRVNKKQWRSLRRSLKL